MNKNHKGWYRAIILVYQKEWITLPQHPVYKIQD